MSDPFDRTEGRDDAGYWDALAERVAANAARESRENGLDWLARSRTGWIAASLLLVAALTFLMLPAETSAARSLGRAWAQALAPADDVGKAIILRDSPPAIGALLLAVGGGV